VHTAGVLDDAVITALDPARLEPVLAAKADAALFLDELTAGMDLALFAVFSSAAGVLGGAGQGNYAAANAVLDAVAARRRAAGLPAISLAWGLWAQTGSGMAATLTTTDKDRMARAGVGALDPAVGLALLDRALAYNEPLAIPLAIDRAALSRAAIPPLLSALAAVPAARRAAAAAGTAAAAGLRGHLAALPAAEQDRYLTDLVTRRAAAVLGHASADTLDPARPFTELGFDSLTGVELRNQLSAATGLAIPATVTFDYPTPVALARYLHGELTEKSTSEAPSVSEMIAKLEDMLAGIDPINNNYSAIDSGLQRLVSSWRNKKLNGHNGHEEDDVESASADEIFAILDNELGKS
jgi:polyketide synthase 12